MTRNFFTWVLLLLITAVHASAACLGPQPRLLCAEYFNSQVVLTATLVAKKHVAPKDEQDWFMYTLRTNKVLRGRRPGTFRIYEENSSGRAPFVWKVGKSYLLFLWYSKETRAWEVDGCGNSVPLNQATGTLKRIDQIKANRGGLVAGNIVAERLEEPLPGVEVEVRSNKDEFRTKTNATGKFELHVPPGQYTVRAARPGWSFRPDEFTYEDPRKIKIENGACAQVQLTGRKTRE